MATQPRVLTKAAPPARLIVAYPGIGSVIEASRRSRPLWFDGRFLAARDMQRDQHDFLHRQRWLGRAAGSGVVHGLLVETVAATGQTPDPETIVIRAGQGITPGGDLVMLQSDLTIRISDLATEEDLDVQFGLSSTPNDLARTRSGLYVVALRPAQFTANPITAYPTGLQGSPTTTDGSIIEATAVSLIPFPEPASNYDATSRNAAAARQIFVTGTATALSESLLPIAMISIQRGTIEWLDPYLVRRDAAPGFAGLRFGLADPAAQQAFLLQYDARLQQIVNAQTADGLSGKFAATDYFQALPPVGRFPLNTIEMTAQPNSNPTTYTITQLFFPQQTDVWLSIIPQDELPAWIEDGLSLPPIDLTQPSSAYADLSVFLLVPVTRDVYEAYSAILSPTPVSSALPQTGLSRSPVAALRFFPSGSAKASIADPSWSAVIRTLTYGYFVRRRGNPLFTTPGLTPTSIALVSDGSDVEGVTLIATVLPSAVTGTVTFTDTFAGTATVLAPTVNLIAANAGVATLALGVNPLPPGVDPPPSGPPPFNATPLAPGTHALTASYSGDANFNSSISAPITLTVSGS